MLEKNTAVDRCLEDAGLSLIEVWYQIDFMDLSVLPNVPTKWESILE